MVIAQICEALFWFSLTLFAVLGVAASVAHNLMDKVRELIEAEREIESESYRAALARTMRRLSERGVSGSTLTREGRNLRQEEKRLRRKLKHLDRLSTILDARRTVVIPGFLLIGSFASANVGKVIAYPWSLASIVVGVVVLVVAAMVAARNFTDIGQLSRLLSTELTIAPDYDREWKTGGKHRISVTTTLKRGTSLHSLQILLYVPPPFRSTAAFLSKLRCSSDDPLMPDYNTIASVDWTLLKRDQPFVYDFDRLSCAEAGKYSVFYRVVTAEYNSPYRKLEIEVVP